MCSVALSCTTYSTELEGDDVLFYSSSTLMTGKDTKFKLGFGAISKLPSVSPFI